jgi:hypothetical protein
MIASSSMMRMSVVVVMFKLRRAAPALPSLCSEHPPVRVAGGRTDFT